jgi:hypothetical protein
VSESESKSTFKLNDTNASLKVELSFSLQMDHPQERLTQRLPKLIKFRAVTRLALFLLIMVEVSSGFLPSHHTQALLVPSQVKKKDSMIKSQPKLLNNGKNNRKKGTLVPSQVLFSNPNFLNTPEIPATPSLSASTNTLSETLIPPGKSNPNQKRRNRRNRSNTPTKLAKEGNLPDIEWCV